MSMFTLERDSECSQLSRWNFVKECVQLQSHGFLIFTFKSVDSRSWPSLIGYSLKIFITFKRKNASSVENQLENYHNTVSI